MELRGSHFWGREIGNYGHRVRLIPPPMSSLCKRQKNDAADAEAICEAAQRHHALRTVRVKQRKARSCVRNAICWCASVRNHQRSRAISPICLIVAQGTAHVASSLWMCRIQISLSWKRRAHPLRLG